MAIEIKAPTFPESVADGTVATWHKKPGEAVKRDELIVDIETDKVVIEVLAEADGVLAEVIKNEGDTVLSNELLGKLTEGGAAAAAPAAAPAAAAAPAQAAAPAAAGGDDAILSPAARKLAEENGIDPNSIAGTGKGGRVTKEDVVAAVEAKKNAPAAAAKPAAAPAAAAPVVATGDRTEKRVPMTRLRAKIAERLVEAQSSMAMLTTFNEVDMQQIFDLRGQYKDSFEKKHGVRLGFMGFFVKACSQALGEFPAVNSQIEGDEIVTYDYVDMGIAVSAPKGLMVPVIRNAETRSIAELETEIRRLAARARDNQLSLEEMEGGTFSITNGGVFGSMLSTPILNPPQAAILGMHNIVERPMAVNGEVKIRPVMYLALSYDHRLIDGQQSVSFLVRVKELLETPARMMLGV